MLGLGGPLLRAGSILIALVLALVLGPLSAPTLENLFWFFTYRFTLAPILAVAPVFALLGAWSPLGRCTAPSPNTPWWSACGSRTTDQTIQRQLLRLCGGAVPLYISP